MSRGVKKTGVYWDVDSCPIPDGHGPGTILQNIESALAKEDPRSEMSIWGYYEKNETVGALFWDYYRCDIFLRGCDKCERDFEMLMGIYIWAIDNRPPSSTLMVISNNIVQGTELFGLLEDLKSKGYNVLVAQPDNVSPEWLLPIHFGTSALKKRKRPEEERPVEEKRDEEKRDEEKRDEGKRFEEKRREKKRREKKCREKKRREKKHREKKRREKKLTKGD